MGRAEFIGGANRAQISQGKMPICVLDSGSRRRGAEAIDGLMREGGIGECRKEEQTELKTEPRLKEEMEPTKEMDTINRDHGGRLGCWITEGEERGSKAAHYTERAMRREGKNTGYKV